MKRSKFGVLIGGGGATSLGYHSLSSFLECPKKYQFNQVRKIYEPGVRVPDHFAMGLIFHAGRARWFAHKFDMSLDTWNHIQRDVQKEVESQKLPLNPDVETKTLALMTKYMQHYTLRPKPSPLAAELYIPPTRVFPSLPGTERTARLDDVSRYPEAGDALCIGEAKTTASSVDDTVNQYELHGQPMLQALLWKLWSGGEKKHGPIAGVMLDVIKKPDGQDEAKFERVLIPINDSALEWYAESMAAYILEAKKVEWDSKVRHNTANCTMMYGRARIPCPYRDLCRHGGSASTKYVMEGGKSLKSHEPEPGKEAMPWE